MYVPGSSRQWCMQPEQGQLSLRMLHLPGLSHQLLVLLCVLMVCSHANKLAPLRPDEVWYFAYGSNMNTKTLTGRRMVRPRQSVPCMVPDHTLSFGVLGFPYTEPGFATIVQSTQQQQQQPAANPPGSVGRMTLKQEHSAEEQSRGHRPCVHGVLHRITKREWAFVQATEGAGNRDVGYQVQHGCLSWCCIP